MITQDEVYEALQEVKDPEIPVISVVDLGVIRDVLIDENGAVVVQLTPTFAGCPAINHMKENIVQVLTAHGVKESLRPFPSSGLRWDAYFGGLAECGLSQVLLQQYLFDFTFWSDGLPCGTPLPELSRNV